MDMNSITTKRKSPEATPSSDGQHDREGTEDLLIAVVADAEYHMPS